MKRRTFARILLCNFVLTVVLGALLINGWGRGSSPHVLANDTGPVNDTGPMPQPQDIIVTVTTDKQTYRRGEILSFTITARNTGKTTQGLTFMSGQRFDLAATHEGEEEREGEEEPAWRWSADKIFTRDIRTETILPGREKTWTAIWEQTDRNGNAVPRGRYRIVGELMSRIRIAATPVTVELGD